MLANFAVQGKPENWNTSHAVTRLFSFKVFEKKFHPLTAICFFERTMGKVWVPRAFSVMQTVEFSTECSLKISAITFSTYDCEQNVLHRKQWPCRQERCLTALNCIHMTADLDIWFPEFPLPGNDVLHFLLLVPGVMVTASLQRGKMPASEFGLFSRVLERTNLR